MKQNSYVDEMICDKLVKVMCSSSTFLLMNELTC